MIQSTVDIRERRGRRVVTLLFFDDISKRSLRVVFDIGVGCLLAEDGSVAGPPDLDMDIEAVLSVNGEERRRYKVYSGEDFTDELAWLGGME